MAANLLSGLVQGYAQAQQAKNDKLLSEELKKAQIKVFKQQLDQQEKTQTALSQLEGMFTGQPAAPQGDAPVGPAAQPKTLAQILADPEGQIAAMRSGMFSGKDVMDANRPDPLASFLGGQGGLPPDFSLQDVVIGSDGKPSLKLGRTDIKHWEPSPDNMFSIGYDAQGNEVKRVPVGTSPSVQTIDTADGPKVVTVDPRTGKQIAEIGDAKADKVTPQEAGSLANIQLGQSVMGRLKSGILNPDGSINRANVINMSTDLPLMGAGVPFTKGRGLRGDFSSAADAVVRARTGAAMTKEEMASMIDEMMPNKYDSDATITSKLNKADLFLKGQLDAITLPPRIAEIVKNKTKPKTIRFEDLP